MTAHRLVLIRHAKAADGAPDVERPLAPRGVRDARAIGAWLARSGIVPDRVVLSPALRARQTWTEAAAALPGAPEPDIDARVYDNEVTALLDIVRTTQDEIGTLVLVGHNPSFAELAHELDDGDGDPGLRREMGAGFPTSAVAVFDLGAWPDADRRTGTLAAFAAPRG